MPDVRPGVLVLVAPPPTPNGPLHVGHLSGPYLAADIAARAARAEGRDVRTVCGLDVHQNWVPARAEALGEPVGEMTARFSTLVKAAFAAARIEYDVFTDPEHDTAYQDYIPALLRELVASGA